MFYEYTTFKSIVITTVTDFQIDEYDDDYWMGAMRDRIETCSATNELYDLLPSIFAHLQKEKPIAIPLTRAELERDFSAYDVKRVDLYAQNLADHHLVTDLLPAIARKFFSNKLGIDQVQIQNYMSTTQHDPRLFL